MGWVGAAIFFDIVLSPLVDLLTTQTRREYILRTMPKVTYFFTAFSLLTLLTGVVLTIADTDGDLSILYTGDPWGLRILISLIITLVIFIIAFTIITPATNKMVKILSQQPSATATPARDPPPDLLAAQRRLRIASMVELMLFFIITFFMVWAAEL